MWTRPGPRTRSALFAFLLLPLGIAGLWLGATPADEPVEALAARSKEDNTRGQRQEEWLWLARAVYSESKRPEEQELVAWVIRNRVDTSFRGRDTYKRVVLDPYQFSAFNPGSSRRRYYTGLDLADTLRTWRSALDIAQRVILADSTERPFPVGTRHFFSERSMPGVINPDSGATRPDWVEHGKMVSLKGRRIDERRFRFYRDVM